MQKKIVAYLFIFYTLFTIYNTLIPFQFHYGFSDLPKLVKQISWTPYFTSRGRVSLVDIAGNIILFLPFGFLLFMLLRYGRSSHPILKCLFAGAALSFLIEFSQLFIIGRDSAPHDLINNALGSWIGGIAAAIYSGKVSTISRKIFHDLLNSKPFALIVVIIGIAQSLSEIMPFTVSVSVSSFQRSVKNSNIIPFDYQSIGKLFLNSPNKNDLLGFDFTLFFENVFFWLIVGYLIMLCYQLYWRKERRAKVSMIFLPIVYFSVLEFAQLFIISRTTDINDIISGSAGIYLGYFLYSITKNFRRVPIAEDGIDLLKFPLILYIIFIIFAGLRPFDWTLAPDILAHDLKADHLIPFYAYFRKHSLWNIFDLIDSILYFMPISLFWTYKLRGRGISFASIYILTITTGLLIGLGIEITQIFSISRVAEITDVLSYGLGGALGTFLIYYFEKEIQPLRVLREEN